MTLITPSPLGSSPPESRRFSQQEIVVGRGNGLDWTLPDPEKNLSRRHFVIRLTGGKYQIEDISTNGVILNDSIELQLHQPVALSSGDRLKLSHAYRVNAHTH
ncbi:MAG: FHA domain-containing protein [Rhodospirillaceae bacterium]